MKVLYISSADPDDFKSGGAQRSNYIRDAARQVAEVDTIVITKEGTTTISLDWDGSRVFKVNTGFEARWWQSMAHKLLVRRLIARAHAERNYDYVIVRYLRAAVLVPFSLHSRMIFDGDDLAQADDGRTLGRRLRHKVRNITLLALARRARTVWLVDPRDEQRLPGARTSSLPNTAAAMYRPEVSSETRQRRIIMVGMFTYPPNEEALVWFSREVMPALSEAFPDVELHAIGRYYKSSLETLGPNVRMRNFVDDLAAEYASAAVAICPVTQGSGTQIKVIEALMTGIPMVASTFSHAGFASVVRPDEHLLVANDVAQWIDHVSAVLRHPDRFTDMAARGRQVAEGHFSSQSFAQRVIDTLQAPGDNRQG